MMKPKVSGNGPPALVIQLGDWMKAPQPRCWRGLEIFQVQHVHVCQPYRNHPIAENKWRFAQGWLCKKALVIKIQSMRFLWLGTLADAIVFRFNS